VIATSFLAASLAGTQAVRVEVVAGRPDARIGVETTWMGEDRALALKDDGSTPGDLPGDGIFVGEWTGEAVRVLPVRLTVGDAEVAAFYEPLAAERDRLVYAVDWTTPPRARRVAAALPPKTLDAANAAAAAAGIGWVGLVMAYVGWLVKRSGAS
jgi:hypothetical protein